ncbi:MAG: protein-disulfide isomerase, partial [Myxococcota bacterium]
VSDPMTIGPKLVWLAAGLLFLIATGCPSAGTDLRLDAAKEAYGAGMSQFEEGNYNAAIEAFTRARGQKWSPLIDGMLARSWDKNENDYRACPYWRALSESTELASLRAEGVDGTEGLTEDAARRSKECWSKGLGLPVPIRGATDAKVTLLVFSEFECPFCSRVNPTLAKILDTWPKDVRLAFMHQPLSFHKNAKNAAKLAVAAHMQGKFWEAHDLLFKHTRELSEDRFTGYMEELGLDAERAQRDMADPGTTAYVERQMAVGQSLGARGTPTFFINGEKFTGAQPFEKFEEKITKAIAEADSALAEGVPRSALHTMLSRARNPAYVELLINGKKPSEVKAKDAPKAPAKTDLTVWKATVSKDDQVAGNADALVTLVMFTDLQCPFCARAKGTIKAVQAKYGADLRVVFKHHPLPFHKDARSAAIAALSAGEQGKFWEMTDRLFDNMRQLNRSTYLAQAKALGLDMGKYKKALDAGEKRFGHLIDRDGVLATALSVRGTPNFFINGRSIRGAQPEAKFVAMIDEELGKARKMVASGTPRAQVYDKIIARGKTFDPLTGPAATFEEQGRPSVGPAKAPVTITIFTDFQCPFCKRFEEGVAQVQKNLPKDVRVVYKQFPLGFHKQAKSAAAAALAAHNQNKFSEMRDLLFADQRDLGDTSITAMAKKLRLNMTRFNRDRAGQAAEDLIKADMAEGTASGVRGTPTIFINGFKFQGSDRDAATLTTLIKKRFLK